MNVHERVRFIRVLAFVVAALWIAAVGPLLLKSEYWVNQVKTAYRGHCWQSAFGWLQLVCQRKENKLDSDDESQTLFETTVLPPPAPTRSFALPPGSNASNIAAGEPDRPISATRPGGDTALVSARAPHPLSTLEEKTLKTMDRFVECEMCPEMVVMPEGNFMMGSQANEPGRRSQEGPQHRVMIVERFAIGRFSVTFDEWSACLSEGGCNGYVPSDQGWGRAWQPVINVSWKDAKAFVDWISRKTGRRYRLPSEGEREYVARAGTTTPFSWGRSISTLRGNYNGNSDYAGGPKGEIDRGPSASTLSDRTLGDFSSCTEIFGSGWKIVGTILIAAPLRRGNLGALAIAVAGYCVAAPGKTIRDSCGRRAVTMTN
jgi:Sulfatase-modifying factor enzyme 1